MGLKVVVCGGRDYSNARRVWDILDGYMPEAIAHGGCTGADSLAEEWAVMRQVPVTSFPANWAKHGKAAGPIRNREMLEIFKPNLLVAFPGGKGTADCARTADKLGITIDYVDWV